jgi:hypothetical protein
MLEFGTSVSPVSGLPSPVTPSLAPGEELRFEMEYDDNLHTYGLLHDRAWAENHGIHNFDNQEHEAEKNGGWDNFEDPLSVHYF